MFVIFKMSTAGVEQIGLFVCPAPFYAFCPESQLIHLILMIRSLFKDDSKNPAKKM
jgi:hypothetical protein